MVAGQFNCWIEEMMVEMSLICPQRNDWNDTYKLLEQPASNLSGLILERFLEDRGLFYHLCFFLFCAWLKKAAILGEWLIVKVQSLCCINCLCLQCLQREQWQGIPCIINKGRDGVKGNMADTLLIPSIISQFHSPTALVPEYLQIWCILLKECARSCNKHKIKCSWLFKSLDIILF